MSTAASCCEAGVVVEAGRGRENLVTRKLRNGCSAHVQESYFGRTRRARDVPNSCRTLATGAESWPNFGRHWPKHGNVLQNDDQMLDNFGPNGARLGRCGSNFDQDRPKVAKCRRVLDNLDPTWHKLGQSCPSLGNFYQLLANIGQHVAKLGGGGPNLTDLSPGWVTFCLKLAKLGQALTKSGRSWSTFRQLSAKFTRSRARSPLLETLFDNSATFLGQLWVRQGD